MFSQVQLEDFQQIYDHTISLDMENKQKKKLQCS